GRSGGCDGETSRDARGAPAGARARGRPAARRRSLRRCPSRVRIHTPPRAPPVPQPVRRRPGGGARGRSVRRAGPVHGVSGTDARGRRRPPGRRDRTSRPGSTLTLSALALATFLLGLRGGGPPGITWSPHAPLEGSLVILAVRSDSIVDVQGTLAGQALHFEREADGFRALGGVPFGSDSAVALVVRSYADGAVDTATVPLPVRRRRLPGERLRVAPEFARPPDSLKE